MNSFSLENITCAYILGALTVCFIFQKRYKFYKNYFNQQQSQSYQNQNIFKGQRK